MRRWSFLISSVVSCSVLVALVPSAAPSTGVPTVAHAAADPSWNGGAELPIPGTTVGATARMRLDVAGGGAAYVTVMEQANPLPPARVVYVDWTGAISAGFGVGGSMTVQSADLSQRIDDVGDGVVQRGNRLYVAGRRGGDWFVSAWTLSGQQDTGFGTDGWVRVTPPGHTVSASWPPVLRVDPDGRLVVVGWVVPLGGGAGRLAYVRLHPDGTADTSFGAAGTGVVLQAIGREVDNTTGSVGGAFGSYPLHVTGTNAEGLGFVTAMGIDGVPVATFGTQGVVVDSFAGCGRGITGANDNELYVLCQYPIFAAQVVGVRRFTIDGALDRSFGDGGWALVPASTSANSRGQTIGNVDGRIVVGGATTDATDIFGGPDWDAAMWAFTRNGQLDLGVGERGVERIRATGNADVVDLARAAGPNGVSVAALVTGGPSSPSVSLTRRVLSSAPATTSAQPLQTAQRVLDTRSGVGAPAGRLAGGQVLELSVTGPSGVPADALAVALNVTSTESDLAGYVTVWPCGTRRPTASNLNWTAGATVPNLVYARLGTAGRVCLFSNVATHLIADVTAYFGADTDYEPLPAPERIIDTRSPTDANAGKVGGARLAQLSLLPLSVPAGRTRAAVLNVTVTEPDAPGFVTVYPCDEPRPLASNLNYVAGQTVANLVTVRSDGGVCFFASSTTHLVVDAQGLVPLGGGHRPLVPTRLLDTREGQFARRTLSGETVFLQVGGRAGIAASARAVTLNVTATEPELGGFVTVFPCGGGVPVASNLNVGAGETRANAATVGIGQAGQVCLYTNIATHLVVDVAEWFPGRSSIEPMPVPVLTG